MPDLTDVDFDGMSVRLDGQVLRLVLNRPDRRNALSSESTRAVATLLTDLGREDTVRAIAITADGEHFCSGMNLRRERPTAGERPRPTSAHRSIDSGPHRLIGALARIEVPVVAAVRGHAAGLGCSLALVADFCVTSDTAVFSTPFTQRGFTPDSGSTWLLPRLIGPARAREMLLLGRKIGAEKAAAWGLVGQVVPDPELDEAAEALVRELAEGATTSLGLTKWLLEVNASATFDDALRTESLAEDIATRSLDFREGITAFTERRRPNYRGN
ncbi:enoyl-CoA hydratase/isomerase family protein [Actinophytocola gossypii]|uniref:Enoyl-CoA hydratase/isomerase family protein n=1 Tax=Actinophytocola gossypii TaxID=2812003 RepID=A0ABT2J382_9PSEU|nr:enoyl-CoA hydratase-related protein [Actinophytocola gossypii]MCT2582241.1 enoyl-CoA hydratase/isomerase family protein [Actinophytocola gossypii]